jgi:hypothetical protein
MAKKKDETPTVEQINEALQKDESKILTFESKTNKIEEQRFHNRISKDEHALALRLKQEKITPKKVIKIVDYAPAGNTLTTQFSVEY